MKIVSVLHTIQQHRKTIALTRLLILMKNILVKTKRKKKLKSKKENAKNLNENFNLYVHKTHKIYFLRH